LVHSFGNTENSKEKKMTDYQIIGMLFTSSIIALPACWGLAYWAVRVIVSRKILGWSYRISNRDIFLGSTGIIYLKLDDIKRGISCQDTGQ